MKVEVSAQSVSEIRHVMRRLEQLSKDRCIENCITQLRRTEDVILAYKVTAEDLQSSLKNLFKSFEQVFSELPPEVLNQLMEEYGRDVIAAKAAE